MSTWRVKCNLTYASYLQILYLWIGSEISFINDNSVDYNDSLWLMIIIRDTPKPKTFRQWRRKLYWAHLIPCTRTTLWFYREGQRLSFQTSSLLWGQQKTALSCISLSCLARVQIRIKFLIKSGKFQLSNRVEGKLSKHGKNACRQGVEFHRGDKETWSEQASTFGGGFSSARSSELCAGYFHIMTGKD